MQTASSFPPELAAPRHTRLFELIRQQNLVTMETIARADAQDAPQHTLRQFANAARRSLLPQEQQALGITASFGR